MLVSGHMKANHRKPSPFPGLALFLGLLLLACQHQDARTDAGWQKEEDAAEGQDDGYAATDDITNADERDDGGENSDGDMNVGDHPSSCPGLLDEIDSSTFLLHLGTTNVYQRFFSSGMVQLRYLPHGETTWRPSWSVVAEPASVDISISFSQDCQQVELSSDALRIIATTDGAVRAEQLLDGGKWTNIFSATKPAQFHEDGQVDISLKAPEDEYVYGLGEKTGPLNRRGQHLVFRNTDALAGGGNYTPDTDPIYQSIPFFIGLRSGQAHGVFLDNTYRLVMDLARDSADEYRFSADGGDMDLYLLAGPDMAQVLDRYTLLTGRMPMPPRWTIGYHQCRWSYWPDDRVRQIAHEFRNRSIPADGLWLDIDYMDGFRSFTWDPQGFSDPASLMVDLAAQGFKTTVIIDPGLKLDPDWDVYQQGLDGNYLLHNSDGSVFVGEVWPGEAVFPDFSSPTTRQWWAGLIPRLISAGVRGVWIDMNEPASFRAEDAYTVPDDVLVQGDGVPSTMEEVHNVYALLMAKATRMGMEQAAPQRRPFVLTRAGFAGIQRYAAVWTGDSPSNWSMLEANLPLVLSLGLSGVSFCGSDVGGFSGNATPELFARWMELGSISPFFRGHVQTGVPDQEPWAFGIEVEDISRSAINLRYRLFPYIYSLFYQSAQTGGPILAPLVFYFQHDPATWDFAKQAMLGPWLIAAPVLRQGENDQTIYLPEGSWYELHSGRRYQGPSNINRQVSLAALPLFVRSGAILPMAPLMQWSDEEPINRLELWLYPDQKESTFSLYEDDGESTAYLDGDYCLTEYRLQRTVNGASLVVQRRGNYSPPARQLLIRVRPATGPAATVSVDGVSLSERSGMDDLENTGQGWWLDENDGVLWILFEDRGNFMLDLTYATDEQPSPTVCMPFSLTVPDGTPSQDSIYIALSSNGWQQQFFGPVGQSGRVEACVEVPRGEWFEYKYTRGDWSTVEKWNGCVEASNRYALGVARPTKNDTVETWADWCQ